MRNALEDPLFDPWTLEHEVVGASGGEPEPTTEHLPSAAEDRGPASDGRSAPNGHRWTSPAGSRGVPAQRPVPPRRPPAELFDLPEPAKPPERTVDQTRSAGSVDRRARRRRSGEPVGSGEPEREGSVEKPDRGGRVEKPEAERDHPAAERNHPAAERDRPEAVRDRPAAEPDLPEAERDRPEAAPDEDASAPELFDVWAPRRRGGTEESAREAARPAPPGRRTPPAHRSQSLRELVLPRLEWLAREVEAAGHRTVLDDRLDGAVPSVRFRLTPRPGPFDDRPAAEGAVIEIASGSGNPPEIVGRLWLDPLSSSPTQQVRVPGAKLTEVWIDRLLLDFVEKALAGR